MPLPRAARLFIVGFSLTVLVLSVGTTCLERRCVQTPSRINWWSNSASQVLTNGTFTLTAKVEPAEWSDWNGQVGTVVVAGFNDAAANVTLVGLSFGGGCFFENGVGTTDGNGTFTLNSFTAS